MAGTWFAFFILIKVICSFVATFDTTFCQNRTEGHYADETDCTYYYQCDQYDRTYHLPCSPGLVWSVVHNSCYAEPCQTQAPPMDSPSPNGTMFVLTVKDSVPVQTSFLSLHWISTQDCALYCFSYSVCVRFSVYQQTCELFKPPTDNNTMITVSGSETWCKYPCYQL